MDDTDILGNKLPAPRRPAPRPPIAQKSQRETPADRRTAKRLDRTAAFYSHFAPPAHTVETNWRHAKWAGKRARVRTALERTGSSVAALHNFDHCGSQALSQWSPTLGRRRLSANYCHSRHCEPCARAKANKIAANLKERLSRAHRHEYRLVTLTQKHTRDPLAAQIRRLYKNFKKLRQTPEWKKTQVGGAFILEVKKSNGQWHPHLHGVVQGKFIDKARLSGLWHQVTGDSFIVDVRTITRHEDAAHYVSKYITKSTSDGVWTNDDDAQEWITASKGLRTCNTFGSWRGFGLLEATNNPNDWEAEDTLVNLVSRANAGDRVAADILYNLRPVKTDVEEGPPNRYLLLEIPTPPE